MKRTLILLSVIAIVLGLFIAYVITRGIVKPLEKAVDVADSLAVGDVGVEVHSDSRDEIGLLLDSMAKMVTSTRDVTEIAKEVAEGNLTVKVVPRSERDELV